MNEKLLEQQQDLLSRLCAITDQVAQEAFRLEHLDTELAEREAFEMRTTLDNVENRLNELRQKRRWRRSWGR